MIDGFVRRPAYVYGARDAPDRRARGVDLRPRHARPALTRGLGRALAIGLAGTMITTSAIGLILLDHDALLARPLAQGMVLALLGWTSMVAVLRRRWAPRSRPVSAERGAWLGTLALVVIVVGGTWMRSDPSPYLHGGQDQGIYVNVGHHIARTGRLRPIDRVMKGELPGLPAELIAASHEIQPQPEGSPLVGVREGRWIAGIHVEDADEGRLVPGFFHLLPVWLAITEIELGFARSTWALVLFAALAQLAAFALGFRLGAGVDAGPHARRRGWLVGLLAAAGLALHPLDLWISSFPVTENLARASLLGSAALALEADAAERRGEPGVVVLAGLAGLVFALGVFARGSMLALALVLAGALMLARRDAAPRARQAALVSLVVGSTLAAMQAIAHSWPYFFSAASNHFHVPRITPAIPDALAWAVAGGAAVLLGDLALGLARRRFARIDRGADLLLRALAWLALAAAFAAALHRLLDPTDLYEPSQQVASVLVRHGGPLGLALGFAGLGLALVRARAGRVWLTLACVILVISALKEGVRYEFYYARYLVGDALPVLIVAAAWLVGRVHAWLQVRVAEPRAALVLALIVIAWWVPPLRLLARPVYWTRDLAHDPEDLAAMFESVPDDALLIFDSREPLRWRGYLATPALLSFDRNVLVYPSGALIERAIAAGTPVYMISGGWEPVDHQRWPSGGPWHTSVVERGVYRATRAEVREGALPERMHEWGGPWELHRFDPSIWRGTGKFSLLPGSRFIAHDQPGRLVSEPIDLRWPADAFVELLVEPGALAGCTIDAALVDERGGSLALARLEAASNRVRFAMPIDASERRAAIDLRWRCPDARALAWRRFGMRWDAR